jgi:hypothetical protein
MSQQRCLGRDWNEFMYFDPELGDAFELIQFDHLSSHAVVPIEMGKGIKKIRDYVLSICHRGLPSH